MGLDSKTIIIFVAIFSAVILNPILVIWMSRHWYRKQVANQKAEDIIFKGNNVPSPLLTWLTRINRSTRGWLMLQRPLAWPKPRIELAAIAEIGLILLWTVVVGRNSLNFFPNATPFGDEYANLLQSHFSWTVLPQCGTCVFWNGFINGGAPAFVDTLGAMLHPLVAITTLLAGVINGSNLVLVGSLALAGIAQWWLARVMGLGRFARLWAGFIVVVGGHLVGKMDNGNIVLVLSTASASLVLGPMLDLALTRRRSSLIWSGITLGLLIVSGQGYLQIGLFVAVLPVLLIFVFDRHLHIQPVWKDLLLALVLGVLLAGIFLVPLLHFMPNFFKDGDPSLTNYQPLEYLPLKLVIHDFVFFHSSLLGRDGNFYVNYIYIGWVPVIFALFSLAFFPHNKRRMLIFFWISIGLVFLVCSQEFGKFVINFIPKIANIRWVSIISGLSVPLIIGLAAWSLDHLWHATWWPNLKLNFADGTRWFFSLSILVVALPAILGIYTLYNQSQRWLNNHEIHLNELVLNELTPATTQWVTPNFHNYIWMRALLERGVKLTGVWRPWKWMGHEPPLPYTSAAYSFENFDRKSVFATYDQIELMRHKENQYAAVKVSDRSIPCEAKATGGFIDVTCSNDQVGILTVQENQWTGWTVRIDGAITELEHAPFLTVKAPAGTHTYQFRYQPWDVWVGLGFTVFGILLALWLGLMAPDPL